MADRKVNQASRGQSSRNSRHVSSQHGRCIHSSRWPVSTPHGPHGRECRPLFGSNEKESTYDNYSKQSSSLSTPAPNLFVTDSNTSDLEAHPMSPSSLPYPLRSAQGSDSGIGVTASPLHVHDTFLSQSPSEISSYTGLPLNFTSLHSDMRVSPIHFQNGSSFFHSTPRETWQETEASPCKKQKIAHHTAETLTPRWEHRRSPRQTHTPHRTNSFSKKLRNATARMCNRSEPYRCLSSPLHPVPVTCHTLRSSPPTSPLQPAFVSQVPITVPVSVYTGPHFTLCQGNAHPMPAVHSIYANPTAHHYQVPSQYTNYVPPQHHQHSFSSNRIASQHVAAGYHHQSTYVSSPPLSPVHFPQPRSPDNLLHIPSPPPIFISENPHHHNAQIDLNSRSRSTVVGNLLRSPGRRWSYHPFQSSTQYPSLFQFLAMFTNPLSSPEIGSPESEMENYEALLHVAARLSEKKPRGLNKVEINQIPSFKFETGQDRGEQTSCVVCMCDFEDRQTLRHLPCSHKFHAKCVDKWLKTNCTCPICRGNATGDL